MRMVDLLLDFSRFFYCEESKMHARVFCGFYLLRGRFLKMNHMIYAPWMNEMESCAI